MRVWTGCSGSVTDGWSGPSWKMHSGGAPHPPPLPNSPLAKCALLDKIQAKRFERQLLTTSSILARRASHNTTNLKYTTGYILRSPSSITSVLDQTDERRVLQVTVHKFTILGTTDALAAIIDSHGRKKSSTRIIKQNWVPDGLTY